MVVDDEIKIISHGTEYKETEEEDYPFCVCPECFSSNTYPITNTRYRFSYGETTGTIVTHKRIFKGTKYQIVNYRCDDCECDWQKKYFVENVTNQKLIKLIRTIICFAISLLLVLILGNNVTEIHANGIVGVLVAIAIAVSFMTTVTFGVLIGLYLLDLGDW